MALRRYSNVAVITALNGAITAVATTLYVQNSTGYPIAPFSVQLENEVILVGAKSGNTFSSLTRGFDGTAASAHADATEVEHVAIADDFNHRWQELILSKPREAWDDEFDTDAVDSAWSTRTVSGSATWTQANGVLSAIYEDQTAAHMAGLMKPVSVASPITLETGVRLFGPKTSYLIGGLVLSDGVSNSSNVAMAYVKDTAGVLSVNQASGLQNAISVEDTLNVTVGPSLWLYMRLRWTATNTFHSQWSPDGTTWTDFGWSTFSATFTPIRAGVFATSWGGTTEGRISTFEYFRLDGT